MTIATLVYSSLRAGATCEKRARQPLVQLTLSQIYYTGCEALPLVSWLAALVGATVVLNSVALSFLGTAQAIANLMIVVVLRELGPLLVALILTARSGTAIATDLANMKVDHELEALTAMAINPLSHVVAPRLIAGAVCSVCLAFYFNVVALAAGLLVTRLFHDLPLALYAGLVADGLRLADIPLFFGRTALNGVIIFAIACHEGLHVTGGLPEVPRASSRAVLSSILAVAVVTVAATALFYARQLSGAGSP